eukprot:gene17408-26749_t
MRESLGDAEQGPSAGAGEKDEPPDAENAPEPQHEEGSDWITSSRANDHYTEGLRRVRGRDFLSAYRSFTKAIFLLPEEPILYVARAETCINLCDLSSAASNYRKATTLQSPPDAAHFDRLVAVLDTLGLAAFCEGRIERALEYFNSALDAQLSATLTRIAEELFAKNSIRQAINYCEESLKWNPDHVSALLLRGECLKVLGDHESAMKDFKRVLEVDGANDEGVWRLGNLHASWGTLLYAQQKYGDWADQYMWHRQRLHFKLEEKGGRKCLAGVLFFGENGEDEWYVTGLLLKVSAEIDDVLVHVVDSDGQFLLIEAADALPPWMDPEGMDNRIFLRNGYVIAIPPVPENPGQCYALAPILNRGKTQQHNVSDCPHVPLDVALEVVVRSSCLDLRCCEVTD